ncbi:unnamed protein product [Schistosoma curassoni]|uniref:Transposase n=1 Tax=Schistosoma curassoni TaxID=6186 RepID=A0A183JR71_9TREM|nr:unnamed protein product [Schistosoma curassoni]
MQKYKGYMHKGNKRRQASVPEKVSDKFVSNPKSLFRYAASLRQAETEVCQLLGPDGPTNNDGDVVRVLAEQYSQTLQWRARKEVRGLELQLYEERLQSRNLYPLKHKRLKGNLAYS